MEFKVIANDKETQARAGVIRTAHGEIETPVFMPVGTVGSVKAVSQETLESIGAQIILGNTYHLLLRPGHALIRELGGLHKFISWPRSMLTDSGGYQVFSLGELRKLSEEGVTFRSHLNGALINLTPEYSIEVQTALGSDIVMCFDECTPFPATSEQARVSLELTTRWARRCRDQFDHLHEAADAPSQGLFGIVQGGVYEDLRRVSLEQLQEIGFAGYAIGGLSVGEPKSAMYEITEVIAPLLPADRPRYLMGVGTPEDLVESVARGVDMFDCVMPTRNARNGQLFTSNGRLNIRNAQWTRDERPIDEECGCSVCQRYSRAYLRHLHLSGEILASILASAHNLYFYLDTMKSMRQAIRLSNFPDFRRMYLAKLSCGVE